ncbi:SnoaL-like domain-containing protein [Fusarium sp. LHS14.1]|nr:SnoaL-like domain-containing protein [Fusarium sp. LHS14.1]
MASLATNLSLSDREAIPDALYRSIIGLDSNDKAIFESAWHQDAQFIFDGTPPIEGLAAILATTFQLIGAGLDTTHMVSNVRIDLKDGADTAKMTAHALAQHYRKGEGWKPGAERFLTGNMYWIDLIKDKSDGLWKMTKFHMKAIWGEGDASIIGQ